jgi:hypothetical protein
MSGEKASCLEELDVGVEEVALGDVDALHAQLVHQAQHARGEYCSTTAACIQQFYSAAPSMHKRM